MSTLQLTFDFEDKLKKFIKDNCGYDFSVIVTVNGGSICIEDAADVEEVNSEAVEEAVEEATEDLQNTICDLQSKLDEAEDRAHYYEEKLLEYEAD